VSVFAGSVAGCYNPIETAERIINMNVRTCPKEHSYPTDADWYNGEIAFAIANELNFEYSAQVELEALFNVMGIKPVSQSKAQELCNQIAVSLETIFAGRLL
jgi:uncharacterized protein YktA (UPF0223 family)